MLFISNLLSDSSAIMFPAMDDLQLYEAKLSTEDLKAIQEYVTNQIKSIQKQTFRPNHSFPLLNECRFICSVD